MENEGTVTISLERYKQLEACEKVALSGALGIDAYDIIGSYGMKYYSTEKAITKLIDENNRLEDNFNSLKDRNFELLKELDFLKERVNILNQIKSMTVKEFKRYKRNDKNR